MEPQPEFVSAFTPRVGEEGPGPARLSVWAVLALLAGMASVVAIAGPMLWPVAGAALVLCVLIKLYLARRRDSLRGDALVTIGLSLAVMFVIAGPTRHILRLWNVHSQAADVGREWLYYIVRQEPYNAYESMRPVAARRPLSPQLEWQYTADKNEAAAYAYFLNNPLIKAIPLLPRPVNIRHYKTERIEATQDNSEVISDVFAIIWYENEREPHTLLVRLELERRNDPTQVGGLWRVLNYELLTNPPGEKPKSTAAKR